MAIKKTFKDNDINIPFPMRTVQFENTLHLKNSPVEEAMYQN